MQSELEDKLTTEYDETNPEEWFGSWCYQKDKDEVWSDIKKIIEGMTNPIQTMEIIIKQMEDRKNV